MTELVQNKKCQIGRSGFHKNKHHDSDYKHALVSYIPGKLIETIKSSFHLELLVEVLL